MNKMRPLVTVGIPTYNRPRGLLRTLECITGQTYHNLEIIVADNCSPGSETKTVVDYYQAKDDRIIYYRHDKNYGATYNTKFVLEKASAEFFMWASDDDEWYPDYIEKCIAGLTKNDSVVLCITKGIIVLDNILYQNESEQIQKSIFKKRKKQIPYIKCSDDIDTCGLPLIKRLKKFILQPHSGLSIFGIARTKIWKEIFNFSPQCQQKYGADLFLLAHLNYFGEVHQIPEYLFVYHHGSGCSANPLLLKNQISKWEYYGLQINRHLLAYLNIIIYTFSWPVSIIDHIRIVGYYIARMAIAKKIRYFSKAPLGGIPFYDYKPPEYPKRDI